VSTIVRQADDPQPSRPPQFGLRTMFLGVTLLSAAFALFTAVGAAISAALLMLGSLLAAHVVGNAIGTRLREQESLPPSESPPQSLDLNRVAQNESAQRLRENTAIDRRWMIIAGLGALIGSVAGGFAISVAVGSKLTLAGLCLGTVSSAVLGGFAGFMAMSFWTVARSAFAEAAGTSYDPVDEKTCSSPGQFDQ
jgi:hypothetical protein